MQTNKHKSIKTKSWQGKQEETHAPHVSYSFEDLFAAYFESEA